jgi:hypothetical protein
MNLHRVADALMSAVLIVVAAGGALLAWAEGLLLPLAYAMAISAPIGVGLLLRGAKQ